MEGDGDGTKEPPPSAAPSAASGATASAEDAMVSGITEEVSCHAVGLRNASDQHQLEEKIDPQLNWQVWEGQGRTCNDLLESEVMNSQIDDVCDDVHASLSRRAKAEETPDGISGRNIDVISFSVVESDVIAQDGVVSYSVLAGADVKNEKACADGREEHLVRGFGDTAESATLGLSVSSLDNSKVIGTQGLYVQLYSEPKYCHTAVAVPIPIESNNLENGVAYDVSTFCPSACEAQEAQEGELCPRQSPNVPGFRSSFPTVPLAVDFKSDGDKSLPEVPASFSVLPPPNEPKVEANEGQDAGPSMHLAEIEQEGSRFSGVNIEGSSNLTGWLQTPQARGKAVVRRGRPRPWPTESREVTRKRVRIDELYDDASPSTELMVFDTPPPLKNSVSQEGREEFARTYEAHDSNVPEPALLPSMGAEPFVLGTSAAPEKDQTHTPVSMTLSSVVDREEIPVKALETILRVMPVTRCGGITLHGNQCTHNVKDGSGFCVKHTKHDIDYRQRTGLECSGTSNRGGMHTPFKSSEMFTIRCRGNTLHGTQCTHSVRDGALYCLKHGDQAWGPPAKRIENKTFLQTPPALTIPYVTPLQIHTPTPVQMPIPIAVQMPTPRPVQMSTPVPVQIPTPRPVQMSTPVPVQIPTPRPVQMSIPIAVQMPTPRPLQMCTPAPVQMPTPRPVPMSTPAPQMPTPVPVQNQAPTIAPASAKEKDDDAAPRCIGRTRRTEEQCSFRPKRGSLFCERHARQFREKRRLDQDTIFEAPSSSSPSASLSASLSLKRRRSQEGVNTGDMNSTRERRSLSKARDMLTDIINAGQLRGKAVSTDGKDLVRWVCEEATRDAVSGEALLNLLSEEKERLRKVLIEDRKKSSVSKPPDFWQTKFSPNLARMSLETLGGQKVCVKRDKENKLQTSASGRSSSEAWVTSESCPSSAQMMKQGSEYGRDVVSNANFAQQVRVGIMEFSNPKEGVRNDLLSSDGHAVGGSSNADTSSVKFSSNGNEASRSKFTCKICGKKFNLLPDLGRHHQAEHPKPNSKLATNILVSQGVEVKLPPPVKRTPLPNPATANSPPWKMIPLSELCTSRLNFENAKQDEHQRTLPGHVLGTQPQSFNFRHLKTIAREKKKTEERIMFSPLVIDPSVPPPVPPPGQPPGPEVAIMKRRRRQKRMEALQNDRQQGGQAKQAKQIVQAMKAVKQIQQERYGSNGQLVDVGITKEDLKAVAKMPPQRASNPTGWPASTEMLDAVRVACCKDSWYRELAKKHANIHKDLHLQAIALCTVMGVDMQWQADAFVCPNQCSPFHTRDAAVPGLEVDMAGFSETPFKSQADHFNDTGRTPLETVNIKDVIKGKHIVIHEDLSNGQETVPIPCVMDEDASRPCSCADCRGNGANTSVDIAGPWKSFSYINKRLLEPSLGLDTESSKLGCACGESRCNPGQCDHVSMFDNDNGEACDKSGAAIRGRFPYDEQGRIILEEGYMVYECNSSCSCLEDCQNRVLQKGVRVKLEVYKSRHKGWAVRAAEPIPSGTFVCEYIGEVVNDREANQRGVRYDQDGCSYLYDIDAHLDMAVSRAGAKPFVIDATKHGNVARFINHSCAPNLINYEVLVESMDCQLAHIGFFANRDIGAGEELAYDYRYKLLPGKGTACHCGASTCRGRLY